MESGLVCWIEHIIKRGRGGEVVLIVVDRHVEVKKRSKARSTGCGLRLGENWLGTEERNIQGLSWARVQRALRDTIGFRGKLFGSFGDLALPLASLELGHSPSLPFLLVFYYQENEQDERATDDSRGGWAQLGTAFVPLGSPEASRK